MAAVVEFDPAISTRPNLVEVLGGPTRLPGVPSTPLRRSALVIVSLVMLALALVSLGAPGGGDAAAAAPERSGEFVVVGPGDTVLSIVQESGAASGADSAQDAVDALVRLNGGSDDLVVGQVVALPALD